METVSNYRYVIKFFRYIFNYYWVYIVFPKVGNMPILLPWRVLDCKKGEGNKTFSTTLCSKNTCVLSSFRIIVYHMSNLVVIAITFIIFQSNLYYLNLVNSQMSTVFDVNQFYNNCRILFTKLENKESSLYIFLLIAKSSKSYTIGKELILPAISEVIHVLHKQILILLRISLSHNSVQR